MLVSERHLFQVVLTAHANLTKSNLSFPTGDPASDNLNQLYRYIILQSNLSKEVPSTQCVLRPQLAAPTATAVAVLQCTAAATEEVTPAQVDSLLKKKEETRAAASRRRREEEQLLREQEMEKERRRAEEHKQLVEQRKRLQREEEGKE
ncbi:hypothetical protein ADEAN_000317000 [Angomonas deanei]|uniref:Uncharacterized protein n=1 Tax=Angomonas deanei TaxID=59799 RepID=A0A7G2C8E1_9TRYP|nr:hypothetical protein ADEAN_000317000 [Angomonas deanei]